jgi:hypothetical protein
MRLGASPGAVKSLRAMNADIDVRAVLPSVRVPTILISTPDQIEVSRYVGESLPQVERLEDDQHRFARIEDFLRRAYSEWAHRQARPERVLATVMFTDLIGSTKAVVELGPRGASFCRSTTPASAANWPATRGARSTPPVTAFSPQASTGPARAIRCACAIRNTIANSGSGSASASTPANATSSTTNSPGSQS